MTSPGASIKRPPGGFSHALREYRNMVHPLYEVTMAHSPNADTVTLCWDTAVAALNDLAKLQQ